MSLAIGKALLQGNVFCEYQPVVSVKGQNLFYHETLVRKQNQEGMIISPMDFLHTIENKKMAAHLTQEVFWQSCKHFAQNQKMFSINLPLIAALDKSTSSMLESMIRNSHLGERIVFEIHGSAWMHFQEAVHPFVHQLKNLGVRFAVDDFGIGKFSFDIFENMAADIIKIDGMFFKSWVDSRWGSTIVRSIVEYARKHNLITIAEEIDSNEAVENARLYGVDMMQGFYIQQPARWDQIAIEPFSGKLAG
jgi:EAL domain-containing protein (putative c-di-GMP-specific phosphodiesterase class I)